MALLKKKSKQKHPLLEPVVNTPYFAARQERQDRQLKLLSAGKLWRHVATSSYFQYRPCNWHRCDDEDEKGNSFCPSSR